MTETVESSGNWSPVGRGAQELITYLSRRSPYSLTWPIRETQGIVEIAPEFDGLTFAQILQGTGTIADGEAAAARVQAYIASLNQTTANIAATTYRTSEPQLLMGSPTNRMFGDRIGWNLLKARLEGSGATVVVPPENSSSFMTWPRDRYVLGPDGTHYYHRALTQADSERLGWDYRHPKPEGMDEETYNQRYPDLRQRAAEIAEAIQSLQGFSEAAGIPTRTLNGFVEGGDVLQYRAKNIVFVGVDQSADGYRDETRVRDAEELADAMGMQLVLVPKVKNPPFYHLDTFMSVLPDGSGVVLPDATDTQTLNELRRIFPTGGLLEVAPDAQAPQASIFDDRRVLTTNFITVNGNVFASRTSPEVTAFLEAHGLRVMPADFDFDYSGPHCQVNILAPSPTPDNRTDIAALGTLSPSIGKMAAAASLQRNG